MPIPEEIADKLAEHSGGARQQSYASGWGTDDDYVREKGYCSRLNTYRLADNVCTGYVYEAWPEYTPVIGCITCKYYRRGNDSHFVNQA